MKLSGLAKGLLAATLITVGALAAGSSVQSRPPIAINEAAAVKPSVRPVVSESSWVQGGAYRLRVSLNTGARASHNPVLLVVLHGDLGTGQDAFAASAAADRDVVAVGILRPGYTDAQGNTSDGQKGLTTGDNYNAQNTDAIAAAIVELKRRFTPRETVLAGHSGGAAIVANILGRHPEIADEALLISCPCDVQTWRRHMLQKTRFAGFQGRVDTLSPIDQITGLSARVRITMIVGTNDDVAPPNLSERYREAATKLGKKVRLIELAGKDHEIFLDRAVFAELTPMLR
jgi:predicted esterase